MTTRKYLKVKHDVNIYHLELEEEIIIKNRSEILLKTGVATCKL